MLKLPQNLEKRVNGMRMNLKRLHAIWLEHLMKLNQNLVKEEKFLEKWMQENLWRWYEHVYLLQIVQIWTNHATEI